MNVNNAKIYFHYYELIRRFIGNEFTYHGKKGVNSPYRKILILSR